jgi:plasmid stabilization system protein ParE
LRNDLSPGIRSFPTQTRYILFYLPAAAGQEGITVVRVLHHARDIPHLF